MDKAGYEVCAESFAPLPSEGACSAPISDDCDAGAKSEEFKYKLTVLGLEFGVWDKLGFTV
jgi:hypothetical protein